MTNIRVALYSDTALTDKIAENTSGDFVGLSASKTYYIVTIGDDLNEATGVTETKKSPSLSVTTDAPPNTAPVANADSVSVDAGSTVTIAVLANDTDVESNSLSIGTYEQPASGGTVTKSGNTLVFTSNGTPGTYTFRYWVYDGQANSLTPATVTVTVNAVVPVDQPGSASITGPATSSS